MVIDIEICRKERIKELNGVVKCSRCLLLPLNDNRQFPFSASILSWFLLLTMNRSEETFPGRLYTIRRSGRSLNTGPEYRNWLLVCVYVIPPFPLLKKKSKTNVLQMQYLPLFCLAVQ